MNYKSPLRCVLFNITVAETMHWQVPALQSCPVGPPSVWDVDTGRCTVHVLEYLPPGGPFDTTATVRHLDSDVVHCLEYLAGDVGNLG